MTADVLGTRALRERVLRTWRTDPARLREDANTEEDHARGYYRDRVVVELAQNAADAAARAGVPGRLLLRLTTAGAEDGAADAGGAEDGAGSGRGGAGGSGRGGADGWGAVRSDGPGAVRPDGADGSSAGAARPDGAVVLVAANTGAPLDAAGVASLASMRASSSRDWDGPTSGGGLVGRFGVGFAAVRAVSDEVAVCSTSGAVRFSLADTRRDLALAAADEPRLADEVARREGSLPALRLPREHAGRPPGGYDTAVVLTLRDPEAVDAVRRMLAEVGDALLLALPALTEVVVEDDLAGTRRRVADLDRRWRRRTAEGELDPALVADRPVEERGRRAWRVTWALPQDPDAALLPAAPLAGAQPYAAPQPPEGAVPTLHADPQPPSEAVPALHAAPQPPSGAVPELHGVPPMPPMPPMPSGAVPPGGARVTRAPQVVHAPTPTDDPLDLPALLVATLPLDPTRRRVARGRATDALLDVAAELYALLAADLASDGEDALRLVPRGLPAGEVDAALRPRLLTALARTPLLPSAAPAPTPGPGPSPSDAPWEPPNGLRAAAPSFERPAVGGRLGQESPDGGLSTGVGGPVGGLGAVGAVGAAGGAGAGLVEPQRAVALAGPAAAELTRALAPWFGGMVVLPEGALPAARALGVEVREVADVVEELPAAANLPPARWRALYGALAPAVADPLVRESLAALPVPLADGRVVRGARGLLLPVDGAGVVSAEPASGVGADLAAGAVAADGADLAAGRAVGADRAGGAGPADGADPAVRPGDPRPEDDLAAALGVLGRWGVRLVHPGAAHPVLERLGATPADPAVLLAHPGVRQAVLDQADEDDLGLAEQVTDAVLTLVRAALAEGTDGGSDPDAPVPAGRAVLGLLTLRDADGEPAPAHGLLLPGSPAAALLDDRVLAPADAAAVERWGRAALAVVGVRADLVVLRLTDVATSGPDLDEDAELVTDGLDGWDDYRAEVARLLGEGESLPEVVAVADLDAVHPDAWPRVLARLAEPGPLRRALLDPVRAERAVGATAPSYTAWWLRNRSGLVPDGPFAVAGAEPAAARLLPAAPADVAGLDDAVQAALGGVARVADVPAADWNRLLRAAAPVGAPVDLALAAAVWSAWADRARAWADGDAPRPALDVLPALVAPDRVALVHAEDAAVASDPMWWQRTDVAAMVPPPGPADPDDLAEALALPTADELADGAVAQDDGDDTGALATTPPAVRALLPDAPATWVEHESLRVDGVPVDWWVEGAGPDAVVHATHLAGLARGLAQAAGAWDLRHAVELALLDPERAAELAVEQAAGGHGMMTGR